ncbi:MAG: carbohydrate ABC transporter permease [Lachnospiraceae bacterium]|nr:carbohydrate ABC transporter permease [Lachnospiraceae bacterium]
MNVSEKKIKQSYSDKIFDIVNVTIMLVLLIIFAWPLWFVLIASFSDPNEVWLGNVLLLPKKITLNSYEKLLEYKSIWIGYANTIFYTAVGTVMNLVMTICCAYPLSQKDFRPRKVLLAFIMFTMYFGGGLIPTYLVVKDVGLLDTRWAMIIPGVLSVHNMLIMRSYFVNSIPSELKEAATLDGANAAQYLIKVVLPLSKASIAVVGLYYGVAHWNDYRSALIYLYDEKLYPLQSVLRDLLMSSKLALSNETTEDPAMIEALTKLEQTLKYSVIIVSSVPVLCIYPFIQKFFVKGVMVGSVKG